MHLSEPHPMSYGGLLGIDCISSWRDPAWRSGDRRYGLHLLCVWYCTRFVGGATPPAYPIAEPRTPVVQLEHCYILEQY